MKKILLVSDDEEMQLNLNAALYRFNIRIVRFENLSELREDYYNGFTRKFTTQSTTTLW